jgi:GT2 family glycosyltransferase
VRALLDRLRSLEPGPDRVVVVDNGSRGDVAGRLAADYPEHLVLALSRNVGFAAGVNRGIAEAFAHDARWVWLLNSDLELPGDALALLLAAATAAGRCGMAAPVLRNADGSVQAFGGGSVDLATGMVRHARTADERRDYLSGACLLLRARMLHEVGRFDEDYFFSFEDVELGLRAREAGWRLAVASGCDVVHHEASSLGAWSEQRWRHLFLGLKRLLAARSPAPRLAMTIRLLHHTAAMTRHGRRDALRGAWSVVTGSTPAE